MKLRITNLLLLLAFLGLTRVAQAQGDFQNFDFESADVPTIPDGQYAPNVSVSSGLPGWNAYIGGVQQSTIWHNSVSLGTSAIIIEGPDFNHFIIDGNYSVWFYSGLGGPPSISQTGLVPDWAESITFEGNAGLQVTLGGQPLSLVSLGSGLFGANISAWAGQTATLSFTQASFTFFAGSLDDIAFSTTAVVPEPEAYALCLFGIVGLIGYKNSLRRKIDARH